MRGEILGPTHEEMSVVYRMTDLEDPERKKIEKRWEKEHRIIWYGIGSDKPIPQWVVESLPGYYDGTLNTYKDITINDPERCISYSVNSIRYDMIEVDSENSAGILTILEAKRKPYVKKKE